MISKYIKQYSSLILLVLVLTSTSFLTTGCQGIISCPPSEELGRVGFQQDTLDKVPYGIPDPNTTNPFDPLKGELQRSDIRFENENGQVISFDLFALYDTEKQSPCISSCSALNVPNSCSFYKIESIAFTFIDQNPTSSLEIKTHYQQGIHNGATGQYYDYLDINFDRYHILNQSFSGDIEFNRTADGTAAVVAEDLGQVTLNGKSFANVIKGRLPRLLLDKPTVFEDLYYSFSKGVVAFTYEGELYTLVN